MSQQLWYGRIEDRAGLYLWHYRLPHATAEQMARYLRKFIRFGLALVERERLQTNLLFNLAVDIRFLDNEAMAFEDRVARRTFSLCIGHAQEFIAFCLARDWVREHTDLDDTIDPEMMQHPDDTPQPMDYEDELPDLLEASTLAGD